MFVSQHKGSVANDVIEKSMPFWTYVALGVGGLRGT